MAYIGLGKKTARVHSQRKKYNFNPPKNKICIFDFIFFILLKNFIEKSSKKTKISSRQYIAYRHHYNVHAYEYVFFAMRRCQEYLVLDVPGLQEKRPSLIVGDRIFISKNLDSHLDSCTNENKFESFIHRIENNVIFLKFHKTFHDNYKGQSVIVESSTAINRHNAIDLVYKNLDEEILFPKKIKLQESQYKVESDMNSNFERYIPMANGNLNKSFLILQEPLKTKKFSWIDQNLNRFQKEAVKNILEGLARPLPYIIFGPPGTGKTITLCEAVLQILVTIPSSKLLVATPSNSSANLVTEKLVRSGVVDPRKLV